MKIIGQDPIYHLFGALRYSWLQAEPFPPRSGPADGRGHGLWDAFGRQKSFRDEDLKVRKKGGEADELDVSNPMRKRRMEDETLGKRTENARTARSLARHWAFEGYCRQDLVCQVTGIRLDYADNDSERHRILALLLLLARKEEAAAEEEAERVRDVGGHTKLCVINRVAIYII